MQTKTHSFIEATSNTFIGLGINIIAQRLIFPLFGIYIGMAENLSIAAIFTVISILRGYAVRRVFNKKKCKHKNTVFIGDAGLYTSCECQDCGDILKLK